MLVYFHGHILVKLLQSIDFFTSNDTVDFHHLDSRHTWRTKESSLYLGLEQNN